MGSISEFIERHFRHFNAAVLKDAADAYIAHLDRGGKMMITLAGAMSTAELGVSLAEMIRQDKVHAITCTGRTWRKTSSISSRAANTNGFPTIGS